MEVSEEIRPIWIVHDLNMEIHLPLHIETAKKLYCFNGPISVHAQPWSNGEYTDQCKDSTFWYIFAGRKEKVNPSNWEDITKKSLKKSYYISIVFTFNIHSSIVWSMVGVFKIITIYQKVGLERAQFRLHNSWTVS